MALPSSNKSEAISWCGGRSRGRAKMVEVPLRRPGGNLSGKNNQFACNDIIEGINNLAINESISAKEISEIAHLVDATKDEEGFRSLFDKLHKRALEDRIFGIKLAKLFGDRRIFGIKINDKDTMRHLLLRALQKDYETREEIRKESVTKFLNSASLLGEMYYNDNCFVLQMALFDYWDMLLDEATDQDIELVAVQVIINGKSMHDQVKFHRFLLNVRKTLINGSLSTVAKVTLLFILDLAAHRRFDALPPILYDYYTPQLGSTVLTYLQRHGKDLANVDYNDDLNTVKYLKGKKMDTIRSKNINLNTVKYLKEKKKDTNRESEISGVSAVHPKEELTATDEDCEERVCVPKDTSKMNFTTESTKNPRAIRGPGASKTENVQRVGYHTLFSTHWSDFSVDDLVEELKY